MTDPPPTAPAEPADPVRQVWAGLAALLLAAVVLAAGLYVRANPGRPAAQAVQAVVSVNESDHVAPGEYHSKTVLLAAVLAAVGLVTLARSAAAVLGWPESAADRPHPLGPPA